MSLITEGLGGPIQGRNNRDSMEAAGKGHVLSTALSFGEVPPNSFIEGLIYFEGTAPALPKNFEAAIVAPDLFPGQVSIKW